MRRNYTNDCLLYSNRNLSMNCQPPRTTVHTMSTDDLELLIFAVGGCAILALLCYAIVWQSTKRNRR